MDEIKTDLEKITDAMNDFVDYTNTMFDKAVNKVYHKYGLVLSIPLCTELTEEDMEEIKQTVGSEVIEKEIKNVYRVLFLEAICKELGGKLNKYRAYLFFDTSTDSYESHIAYLSRMWDYTSSNRIDKTEVLSMIDKMVNKRIIMANLFMLYFD